MKIEILGSGGAIPIPRPLCTCSNCEEARKKGVPYSRTGPSIFVHDIHLLIDTPEESAYQLNRSKITEVTYCTYSHWHPDHTMGRRVLEMNYDWRYHPSKSSKTTVLLPEGVVPDFEQRLGLMDQLNYFKAIGIVDIRILQDSDILTLGKYRLQPLRLAEAYVYGFIITSETHRVLIIMDELVGWTVPEELGEFDLAILPAGVFDVNPLTGKRTILENHPMLITEATFTDTLNIVKNLKAQRVVLSHIEEVDGLSYDHLLKLETLLLQKEGLKIEFAYDQMILDI